MARLTEAQVIKIMRNEYRSRLLEVLDEADVYDSQGNMILSPGLKVRHKDSQFEYTVDHVTGDEKSGDLEIHLTLPDEPRFEPPTEEVPVMTDQLGPDVLGEVDPASLGLADPTSGERSELAPGEEEGDVFIIDQEEFEKEYEVK